MKILMLGNSFTTANRMPDMLAELTGAEDCATYLWRARLAEHLDAGTHTVHPHSYFHG